MTGYKVWGIRYNGQENFYILRHTLCLAILIENFFMDNKKDLAYLLSQEGRRAIVETIIDGIERCVLTLLSGYSPIL
ncbi:MAG: N-acetylmuramoyl-L-alanine amidase [Bacteroidales bacterium]|nr:N-acetylmuramoyl-L-alanine amidase [Bacteroidales bacterium]MBQ8500296.1 N-acetylmuramoyl-L-alanine amidase [Bacteroidales bacterium]